VVSAVKVSEAVREPFYTPKTLAALLQVSERTVRTMLAERRIASYRVLGQRRVSAEDLAAFLAGNRDEQRR
jgi:excisionase family DNA binding protein